MGEGMWVSRALSCETTEISTKWLTAMGGLLGGFPNVSGQDGGVTEVGELGSSGYTWESGCSKGFGRGNVPHWRKKLMKGTDLPLTMIPRCL